MRAVGAKRPRGLAAAGNDPAVPWTGRVPKPAMDKDSWVDYGSGFLRKSCDSCVSSKRRCDGQDPCTRCSRRKKPCHYTERKKCGPRSGQKTTSKGTRRPSSTQQAQPHSSDLQQEQSQGTHHRQGGVPRAANEVALEVRYSGLQLRHPPHPIAAPTLSAGELSGDTTCVDYTDCSDGPPPHQMLLRDESGSSWWSLDEQGTAVAAAAAAATTSANRSALSTAWVQQHGNRYGRGGVPQYEHEPKSERHRGEVWQGPRSASGGSGADSSEDDASVESLGQAEEEVAALLVRLGRTDTYFEGFSEDDTPGQGRPPYSSCSREGERCWSVGVGSGMPGRM